VGQRYMGLVVIATLTGRGSRPLCTVTKVCTRGRTGSPAGRLRGEPLDTVRCPYPSPERSLPSLVRGCRYTLGRAHYTRLTVPAQQEAESSPPKKNVKTLYRRSRPRLQIRGPGSGRPHTPSAVWSPTLQLQAR